MTDPVDVTALAETVRRGITAQILRVPEVPLAALDALLAEVDRRGETIARLNRRAQQAEAVADENVEACRRAGQSFGRGLANYSATHEKERAEAAEAEVARLREVVRVVAASLPHAIQPGILHRKDNPRPDGTFLTPGEERPHYSDCVPCRLAALAAAGSPTGEETP